MKFNARLYNRRKTFEGEKCGKIECQNSYCTKAAFYLEGDRAVKAFGYRVIPYFFYNPISKKTNRNYFDFYVENHDGTKTLLAIVPDDFHQLEIQQKRIEGMKRKANELGFSFQIWGEEYLFGKNPEYRKSIIHFMC